MHGLWARSFYLIHSLGFLGYVACDDTSVDRTPIDGAVIRMDSGSSSDANAALDSGVMGVDDTASSDARVRVDSGARDSGAQGCDLLPETTMYSSTMTHYDSDQSRDHEMRVYRPEGPGPNPGMLVIHGGGWRQSDYTAVHGLADRYARRGFTTFAINYQLSTPTASAWRNCTSCAAGLAVLTIRPMPIC